MSKKIRHIFFFVMITFSCEARICFLHIPKCGGTTIHSLLEKSFDLSEVYTYNYFNCDLKKELITGHISYSLLLKNELDFNTTFFFACIREPVDRVISEYRYLKQRKQVESPLDVQPNMLCHMLCSNHWFTKNLLLEDCIETLKTMDFIIFFDDFENDINLLFEKIQFPSFEEKIPRLNPSRYENIDPEMIEKIKEANALDIQLYEYAKTHLKHYSARFNETSYQQHYETLHELLKVKQDLIYTFDMPLPGSGWYHRENVNTERPIYVWARNGEGTICLNLDPSFDYVVQFHALKLVDTIELSVKVNDRVFLPEKLNNAEFSLYQFFIPKELLQEGLTKFSFCASHSYPHNTIHPSIDSRPLSIALNRIEIHHIENAIIPEK